MMTSHVSIEFIEQVMERGDCAIGEGDELIDELFGEFRNGSRAREKVEEESVVCCHLLKGRSYQIDGTGGVDCGTIERKCHS